MLTLRDLRKAARAHGATVEDDSGAGWTVYQMCAPVRKVWGDGGCHCMRVEWRADAPDAREWKQDAIKDALARMACGLDDCDGSQGCDCYE